MTTIHGEFTVSINNGPLLPCQLDIETEMVDVSTHGPRPDPNWTHVDSNGHYHAYDQADRLNHYPTLVEKSEYHRYDEDEPDAQPAEEPSDEPDEDDEDDGWEWEDREEGWTETWYECAICGDRIEPGKKPGPFHEWKPGLTQWHLEVQTTQPATALGEKVSVRIPAQQPNTQERFGIAMVTQAHYNNRDGYTLELIGIGPLGTRKARP